MSAFSYWQVDYFEIHVEFHLNVVAPRRQSSLAYRPHTMGKKHSRKVQKLLNSQAATAAAAELAKLETQVVAGAVGGGGTGIGKKGRKKKKKKNAAETARAHTRADLVLSDDLRASLGLDLGSAQSVSSSSPTYVSV